MSTELVGKVLRYHTNDGYIDRARIVHQSRDGRHLWTIMLPRRDSGKSAREFYIKAPCRISLALIEEQQERHMLSLVDFVPPARWLLTDHELANDLTASDLGKTARRDLPLWYRQREEQKIWIEPILEHFGAQELLECDCLRDEVRKRAKQLGHKGPGKVARAMRLHFLGCGHPNSLLPAWGNCGGNGKPKFASKKAGRPRRAVARGHSAEKGYVCSPDDRRKLVDGWRKYKKRRVSVYDAYLLTCHEYWPNQPPHCKPTIAQFKWAASRAGLFAWKVNLPETIYQQSVRALRGSATDGVVAVGQLGVIDSTSEDQTPVSAISRLKVLPSTWRTVLMDVRSEYILGLHSGFENPSGLTSLLCILSSASSKVEFCARYGIQIQDSDWHYRMCKRIRADNGETKNELNIKTMSAAEASIEIVLSYGCALKGPMEASHHSTHRRADHKNAGSTKGERRNRGEARRELEACRTHAENMPFVIRAILRHNNEEIVERLLTLDMRRDGVQPTRKAIYEWLVKNGYVASEPIDLDMLRAQCLPRLAANIHRDGVHIFDPLDSNRLIPQLRYISDWLFHSGLCEKAGKSRITCEVLLNPNDLSHCFLVHDGIKRLERKTSDPRANEITLCEHLEMTYDDKEDAEVLRAHLDSQDSSTLVENRKVNRDACAAKRAEKAAESSSNAKSRSKGFDKRKNRQEELKLDHLQKLGYSLDQAVHADVGSNSKAPSATASAPRPLTANERQMQELRQARRSQ